MAIITLTSDYGLKDFLVAALKGSILSEMQDAVIVDISHQISPYDISEAAYILKNSYGHFPKGTIHVIAVDELEIGEQRPICALMDGHYFICNDNGILSLIFSDIHPEDVVEITVFPELRKTLFPSKDLFVPIACHLARGGAISVVGTKIKEIKTLHTIKPVVKEDRLIAGMVFFVDNFGNVVTNISRKLFDQVGKKRSFFLRIRNHEFKEIYENYTDVVADPNNESRYFALNVLLFNSADYLEISVYKGSIDFGGSASTLFGLKKGDQVSIEFI